MNLSSHRYLILTAGHSDPVTAKTAASVIRYRRSDVVAVLDPEHAGRRAETLLGVGGDLLFVGRLEDAPEANALLIGTAPTGGRLPAAWRAFILAALTRGMHVVSGLHDFLGDDPEFTIAAAASGAVITDVRRNEETGVSLGQPLGNRQLRIHTVGHDCSIGKMLVTLELQRALAAAGASAKFLATGQTGIMIAGEGVPVDTVVADFVAGAAERLVLRNPEASILLIEGQGSLAHPMYSAVTLGLLHGCQPQGLILCVEAGREECGGIPGRKLRSLAELRHAYETAGRLVHPTEVIGIAVNSRRLTAEEAARYREQVREETQLPVCDVIRDGPTELVDAILAFQEHLVP